MTNIPKKWVLMASYGYDICLGLMPSGAGFSVYRGAVNLERKMFNM